MFLAMLWMERWLKFLSDASAQYAPPQLTYTAAGKTPEASQAAEAEEARLLQDALDERDQAVAGLLLARGELLSQLARVSGEAAAARKEAERVQAAADGAVMAERQTWAGENDRLKAEQRRAYRELALERAAARAERDAALLAERHAWAGENDRLKAAQRHAYRQLALERAAARAERDAWAGEDERLKQAQRQLRVAFAVERADALAAQASEQAAAQADADAAAKATLAQLRSALNDRDVAIAGKEAALAEAKRTLATTKDDLAEARAEILRLRSEAERARANERETQLAAQPDAARSAGSPAPATAQPPRSDLPGATAIVDTPAPKTRAKSRTSKARAEAQASAPERVAPAPVEARRPEPARETPRKASRNIAPGAKAGDLVVRFRKPADWAETPFVYFWDTDPVTDKPAWPGKPMQAEADGWFVHRFQGIRAAHLIFTDDAGHQTPNLHRDESGWLDANGDWRTDDDPEPAT